MYDYLPAPYSEKSGSNAAVMFWMAAGTNLLEQKLIKKRVFGKASIASKSCQMVLLTRKLFTLTVNVNWVTTRVHQVSNTTCWLRTQLMQRVNHELTMDNHVIKSRFNILIDWQSVYIHIHPHTLYFTFARTLHLKWVHKLQAFRV